MWNARPCALPITRGRRLSTRLWSSCEGGGPERLKRLPKMALPIPWRVVRNSAVPPGLTTCATYSPGAEAPGYWQSSFRGLESFLLLSYCFPGAEGAEPGSNAPPGLFQKSGLVLKLFFNARLGQDPES